MKDEFRAPVKPLKDTGEDVPCPLGDRVGHMSPMPNYGIFGVLLAYITNNTPIFMKKDCLSVRNTF